MKKVDALTLQLSRNTASSMPKEVCSMCASPMHTTQACPYSRGYSSSILEQMNTINDFRKPMDTPFPETNNQGWNNHSNFTSQPNQSMNNEGGHVMSISRQNVPSS